MSHSFRIVTRSRTVRLTFAALLAAGCSRDGSGPSPTPASIELVSPNPVAGIPGHPAADFVAVRVLDQDGHPLPDVDVIFDVTGGGGTIEPSSRRTDAGGQARVAWRLGDGLQHTGRAFVRSGDGGPAPALDGVSVDLQAVGAQVSETAASMLGRLRDRIGFFITSLANTLPLNQLLRAEIEAKMVMLSAPDLGTSIILDERFVETHVARVAQATIPIVGVFPLEMMRTEAAQTVRHIESSLAVLEPFVGPWPAPSVQLWYGFEIGSSGGGGSLDLEDRTSFTNRGGGSVGLPYNAMVGHELAHTYISNESMTQFLELYVYNVLATGSENVAEWAFTRDYTGPSPDNFDVHALLDVYLLVGSAAMSQAYRAILPFRPRYGAPLSDEAIDAFAAEVPTEHREVVMARLRRIRS